MPNCTEIIILHTAQTTYYLNYKANKMCQCYHLILLFINQNWFYSFFFSSSSMHQSNLFLLNAMLQVLMFWLYLFTCFVLFISITPSHKSNMNNSLKTIIINIIIIEVNIVKEYSVKSAIAPSYPLFVLMILVLNFMLIQNQIET